MKTIATKLDNDEFEEFLEICNDEGCSKSEMLRKLVKDFTKLKVDIIEDESEDDPPEPETCKDHTTPIVEVKNVRIYDDDGRLVAVSKK